MPKILMAFFALLITLIICCAILAGCIIAPLYFLFKVITLFKAQKIEPAKKKKAKIDLSDVLPSNVSLFKSFKNN